ncbi:hypothetical protein SLS58_001478 [Diplodia intermedia]|uniref:Major facilitator superfamily (MFS) profile domain-containing protein n=1 Tax=Diplodia intermedia TaxID=856260 RepID=A0ABR3U1D9_9PEZI
MDERSPLLAPPPPGVDDEAALPSPTSQQERTTSKKKIISVLAVLLIGVLLSNADVSIVLATHALIASEFDDLSNSSWIFVGKLSDLYGRKPVLLITYALFTVGCFIIVRQAWEEASSNTNSSGIAPSLGIVILGRVLSGIGSAGMSALVSIIITGV